jgi:hypothetical protein
VFVASWALPNPRRKLRGNLFARETLGTVANRLRGCQPNLAVTRVFAAERVSNLMQHHLQGFIDAVNLRVI